MEAKIKAYLKKEGHTSPIKKIVDMTLTDPTYDVILADGKVFRFINDEVEIIKGLAATIANDFLKK